jgi:hypothetical protein
MLESMRRKGFPDSFPICHDDHHAEHVGVFSDGTQYFMTNGFVPQGPNDVPPRREFACLYLFRADGTLLEADIRELQSGDHEAWERHTDEFARRFENGEPGDITVRPFSIQRFGVEFGLIPREPDEPDADWWVILEPGNFMAFCPPWDGTYDT